MRLHSVRLLLVFTCSIIASLAADPSVGVQNATIKVRPNDTAPTGTSISLSAARNEFEPFQIIVNGGDSGVTGVNAVASTLISGENTIAASEIMLYYEGLYNAVYASNEEGATGYWPDPLIPKVDAYQGETRNAFPFDVPAGENRGIWVEIFVPATAAAGTYTGTITVSGTGISETTVSVTLLVRNFTLPPTSSMRSAFGIDWSGGCIAQKGSYGDCGGESGIAAWIAYMTRVALDHRITINNATYAGNRNDNWAFFDKFFGPQFDGTADTRLVGAAVTSQSFNELDTGKMQGWRDHFDAKGWGPLLFDYTCDEPPVGCTWGFIENKAAIARAAGIPTLVTTDISAADANGVTDDIDLIVPLMNYVWDKDYITGVSSGDKRADYDTFLARAGTELWAYQSCMSHACGPATAPYWLGRPSYMIDATGVANRIMEWWMFREDIAGGELYWGLTAMYGSAWSNQWAYHGNGDGTLFYPGTPAQIGGTTHITIESIRLKLIRESMEDYEYMDMLCDLGDCDFARNTVAELIPAPYDISGVTANAIYTARAAMASRIEALQDLHCDAGAPGSFRAGVEATLDGTRSRAEVGRGQLTYFWQQLDGPTQVSWSDRASSRPTITGLVAGSYTFQLTVSQESGSSSSCTVKHGAIATDENHIVVTGDSALDFILGPQIRLGANPWPWYDERNRAAADLQSESLGDYYLPAYWDTPAAGTVDVEEGSTVIEGHGTSFTTTFCLGPENPTVSKPGAHVIVWYPTGQPEETGRRSVPVDNCIDDTHLATESWGSFAVGGGLNYSYEDEVVSDVWTNASSPANYYDSVMGFYSLYYRSGIADYLETARTLADLWWRTPGVDRGNACAEVPGSAGDPCLPSRAWGTHGLVLRAMDGRGDMWAGLHKLWDRSMQYLGDTQREPGTWDVRDAANHLEAAALCAMFDIDEAYRAQCRTAISSSFATLWSPAKGADGSWPALYFEHAGWGPTPSSVSLVHGQTIVIGNGTAWTQEQLSGQRRIWFTNSTARPADNAEGDLSTYSAVYVSANHLELDRPYEGQSGVHGWAIGRLLGWGAEPSNMGMLAAAFGRAASAIADWDPENSALARNSARSAVDWIMTYGYRPSRKGLYAGAQFVNCPAPIAENNEACTGGNNESQARSLSAHALRGIGQVYRQGGDTSYQQFGDLLYSAMFSKPGTGGLDEDGYYISDLDDGTGAYMTGTPPLGKAPKWFGLLFGDGSLAAWPGYRVDGARPPIPRDILLGFDFSGAPGAEAARAVVQEPTGTIRSTDCAPSPCQITVDARQGDHLLRLEYTSMSGHIQAVGEPILIRVR